jgi:putative effector of murein hydrolase LrgA (UPF0299 family)
VGGARRYLQAYTLQQHKSEAVFEITLGTGGGEALRSTLVHTHTPRLGMCILYYFVAARISMLRLLADLLSVLRGSIYVTFVPICISLAQHLSRMSLMIVLNVVQCPARLLYVLLRRPETAVTACVYLCSISIHSHSTALYMHEVQSTDSQTHSRCLVTEILTVRARVTSYVVSYLSVTPSRQILFELDQFMLAL